MMDIHQDFLLALRTEQWQVRQDRVLPQFDPGLIAADRTQQPFSLVHIASYCHHLHFDQHCLRIYVWDGVTFRREVGLMHV